MYPLGRIQHYNHDNLGSCIVRFARGISIIFKDIGLLSKVDNARHNHVLMTVNMCLKKII